MVERWVLGQMLVSELALEKETAQFKQDNNKLAVTKKQLTGQVEDMNTKIEDYQSQLQSLSNQTSKLWFGKNNWKTLSV
ncbi:hypothetical protein ACFLV5_03360 [Chloroflexota bacterium]